MKPGATLQHLDDMIAAGERALRHVGGRSLAEIQADELRTDAIVRALEVVGEACKRMDRPFTARFPEVPWRKIAGMRDVLIHKYDEVNWPLVWETLTVHLTPALDQLRAVRSILESESPPPPPVAP